MRASVLVAALVLATPLALAAAPSIGLFSDPDCTSCNLSIPPGNVGTFYITMDAPPEDLCGGTGGAEFRVEGLPAGWTAHSTPAPVANLVLGNPFGDGAQLGFVELQRGACIRLYTVSLTAGAGEAILHVTAHMHPSHPSRTCPNLLPGPPCDGSFCVAGGTLLVNSSTPCSVGVQRSTWSTAKLLYRY